jgi:hypothetical protein
LVLVVLAVQPEQLQTIMAAMELILLSLQLHPLVAVAEADTLAVMPETEVLEVAVPIHYLPALEH